MEDRAGLAAQVSPGRRSPKAPALPGKSGVEGMAPSTGHMLQRSEGLGRCPGHRLPRARATLGLVERGTDQWIGKQCPPLRPLWVKGGAGTGRVGYQ